MSPAPLSSLKMWLILLSICSLVFLLNIDYTAANLALIPISEDTSADLNSLQWLLSGYVLVWGALVVPAGRLADLYGKRRILLIGTLIFLIGSFITGFGNTIEILVFGRVLQGVGAAIFSPACYGLIFTTMPPEKQGLAMGVFSAIGGLGLAAGPTLAGLILEELNWRWIFYINIPIGFFVMMSVLMLIPKDLSADKTERIDFLGAMLLSFSLGSLMIGLNQIEVWGAQSIELYGILSAGVVGLCLFYHQNKKQLPQTIPLIFFHNKPLMGSVYAIFLTSFNFSLVLVMMGLFVQKTLGYSSYESGFIFLSMTLAIGILSPIGGRLADRMDMRTPIIFGLFSLSLATFFMSILGENSSLYAVLGCLFLSGLGLGFSFPCINTAMFRSVNPMDISTASGIFTMSMMLGNTLSVILSTSLLVMFGRTYLQSSFLHESGALSLAEQQAAFHQLERVSATSPLDAIQGISEKTLSLVSDAFVYGFSWNMRIGLIFALLATFIVFRNVRGLSASKEEAHVPAML